MPISGIVITFDCPDTERCNTLDVIARDTRIELGESMGVKTAAVLETENQRDDRDAINWLRDLNGVSLVDVVFVHFEEMEGQYR